MSCNRMSAYTAQRGLANLYAISQNLAHCYTTSPPSTLRCVLT